MLEWYLWTVAWMRQRLVTWTTCVRNCAQNMFRPASNPLANLACATGSNATRPCAGSLTVSQPTTRMSCYFAPAKTRPARNVVGRPSFPAALMKAWKSPAALRREGSARLTTSASKGRFIVHWLPLNVMLQKLCSWFPTPNSRLRVNL